jgi:hypothetical protein
MRGEQQHDGPLTPHIHDDWGKTSPKHNERSHVVNNMNKQQHKGEWFRWVPGSVMNGISNVTKQDQH